MWEGPRHPCSFASPGSLHYKMWAGLNGYDPRTDLVLGGVRIGIGCMNLVTVISRYTRVPVTLIVVGFHWHHEPSIYVCTPSSSPQAFWNDGFYDTN